MAVSSTRTPIVVADAPHTRLNRGICAVESPPPFVGPALREGVRVRADRKGHLNDRRAVRRAIDRRRQRVEEVKDHRRHRRAAARPLTLASHAAPQRCGYGCAPDTRERDRSLASAPTCPVARAACSLGTPLDLCFRPPRPGPSRSQRDLFKKDRHDEGKRQRRGYHNEHVADG